MPAGTMQSCAPSAPATALESLASLAAENIPGVDFASITVHSDGGFRTIAATDELADECDQLQYDAGEGPCVAAVTRERLVLVNDLVHGEAFSHYGPLAARRGVGSQAAVQLTRTDQVAGLNLYSRQPGAFDELTIRIVELFASYGAVLLGYAHQLEHLRKAVDSRQVIGAAVGILMERYGIDWDRAFAFLVRNSQNRNVKLRLLAQQVLDGTFRTESREDPRTSAGHGIVSRFASHEMAAG
ncbi:GAF and ANTAR domain-containing protein [Aeromicrobium chenweiae]|uniref:Transcription antitermination regulator n=1 Tax=Aeromicrobium chenweiae TaxID=2079793 RepID=A0A2S0WL94_9ACTN|nr:GAF and ANTAR domain-containing protein [Aeromicrobium chenweiae]AWB92118.1 transcription antitermination regulator [Aeromicrobium chenweiae]TGN32968.1 ANTAR domain-containing protein [Aeromicrobium chenweiae]